MQFRELTRDDFAFALEVTERENWGVTERDLERIVTVEPHGTFLAVESGNPLGMASGFSFGELGWIGNVIVGNKRRGSGVGKLLVQQVTAYLRGKQVKHIGLYTYDENIPFYEKLAFRKVVEFARFLGKPTWVKSENATRGMEQRDLVPVGELDKRSFGGDRRRLLELVMQENPNICCIHEDRGVLDGFVLAKDYGTSLEVGPLVSLSGPNAAVNLLNSVLERSEARVIELGAFTVNKAAVNMFERCGLSVQRKGAMMLLKERWQAEGRDAVFAFGFLDKG